MRKNLFPGEIILSSSSPRRRKILSMFFKVYVVKPSVDEKFYKDPIQMVMENSERKVLYVKDRRGIVVSGDTVVVFKRKILGKPKNEEDAVRMLSLLSNNWHEVYSGFSFIYSGKIYRDFSVSRVKFRKMDKDEIVNYVKSGEPMDKAGGYAIQGKGSIFVERISGCYFAIVGFPVVKFIKRLKEVVIENS